MSVMFDRRGDTSPPRPLPAALRRFHWATVALLVVMFALAWTFDALGPSPVSATLVDLHRSFGLLILAVVALRLLWRLTHRVEPLAGAAPRWERWLASGVQAALYLALLAMPLVGWLASAMAGDTVRLFGLALPDFVPMNEDRSDRLFEFHGFLGWVILALAALHVLGALRHHFLKRDGLLNRMRIG
ncbi:cytochrome b [Aureimonas sp. AU4]|uniref:cytochrome b n=1 Tax=Aureimonas sp. AU4 TaxID=1638163 RepID=UPI0007832A4A|nr:cytochrome b [Aureimonas sp. AU4]